MEKARQTSSSAEAISVEEQERFLSVLSFWHKLEYFVPFDLDQRISEAEDAKIIYLHRHGLDCGMSNLWQAKVERDEKVTGFHLYLCVESATEFWAVALHD